MKHINALFVLLILTGVGRAFDPEVLFLKAGEEYPGELIEITSDSVFFLSGGTELRVAREGVTNVEFTRRRPGDTWTTLSNIDDSYLRNLLDEAPDVTDYPNSAYVNLLVRSDHVLERSGSSRASHRRTVKILQQDGSRVANEYLLYLSNEERVSVAFGRSVAEDGVVSHIRDAAIDDLSRYSRTPAYDNLHQLQFALPEAQKGAVLDHRVDLERASNSILSPFYVEEVLGDREPVLEAVVRVTVPEGTELLYAGERIGDPVLIVNKDATETYLWQIGDIEAVFPERHRPPVPNVLPRVVAGTKTTWAEIDDALARSFEEALSDPGRLFQEVQRLIEVGQNNREKARALYRFVAIEIHDVRVPMDEYGYRPKYVSEILGNRFGNTLDKAFLLYAMLQEARIPSQMMYVRSHGAGGIVEEVPSVAQFDRAVVLMEDSLYLDPTEDTTPFGELVPGCRGAFGLLVGSGGALISTPMTSPRDESDRIVLKVELQEDGTISVHHEEELSGSYAMDMRGYKGLSPEELDVEMNLWVAELHPRGQLIGYTVTPLDDLDAPVRITLDYEVPGYASVAGDKYMSFRTPELAYTAVDAAEETRRYPMDWETRDMTTFEMSIELPQGYKVKYLPEKIHCKNEHVSYAAEFKEKKGVILFKDAMKRHSTYILPSDYPLYRSCIQTMARVPNEVIVLEKK
jgi:hypothetical protein